MKNILTCPTDAQFAKAISNNDHGRFNDHFALCDTCQKQRQAQQAIQEMLKRSERETPKPEHVAAMRANLLEEALFVSERKRSRIMRPRTLVAVFAAVAVLGLTVLFYSGIPQHRIFESAAPTRVAKGTVHGDRTSDFAHFYNEPDEFVRLKDGNITVSVNKLNSGERFRVITGDAEVEVRGTAFDVSAKDDVLVSVKVHSGQVAVRTEQQIHILDAGKGWKRMESIAEPLQDEVPSPKFLKSSQRPRLSAKRKHGTSSPKPKHRDEDSAMLNKKEAPTLPSLSKRSPAEEMFTEGFDAFKRGEFHQAEKRFKQALVLEGYHTIAQDASFWRAAALAKAREPVSAQAALKDFLREFPTSPRAKEASVILGWQVLALDPHGAKSYFEAGRDAADPNVRKSSAKGLSTVKEMLKNTD